MDKSIFTKEPANTANKIFNFFKHIPNGVFVEAGALDGLFQSNTLELERMGWTGLLVEPLEKEYSECVKNRTSPVENYALVSFDYKDDSIKINPDGAFSKIINNGGGVEVKTKTITELLNKHNITHIDFFSLDVEGYEMEILKGLDFNAFDIEYFLIEVNTKDYSLKEMNDVMLENGYENIADVSYFRKENTPTWPGTHQDYLYKKINHG